MEDEVMIVYLIGFMGSGKTTVAAKLASRWGYPAYDLDQMIEKAEGLAVKELFSRYGEEQFRAMEHQYLSTFNKVNRGVVSTGGGTPCYFDNMAFMNSTGITVYLRMTPGQLYGRLKQAGSNRPVIQGYTGQALLDFIDHKLGQREPFYRQATLEISGFDLDIRDLEREIFHFQGQ